MSTTDKSPLDEKYITLLRELEAEPLDVRELVIENDNPVWVWLMRCGALIRKKDGGPQYERADRITTLSRSDGRLERALAPGRHCLEWREWTFEVVVGPISGETSKETARILLKDQETCAAFEEFLRYARERGRRKGGSDADKVVVKVMNNQTWKQASVYPKRSPESVVTGDSTVTDLISHVRRFVDSEEDYVKYGRPFKCNVLITGFAGAGKSSLITVLASEFDRDICFISITPGMDEKNLGAAIANIGNNSMLVIEDVDVLCSSAMQSSGAQNAMAVLTSVLDGTLHRHGMITILTTTCPDALEGVLVRHGRIDYTCRLKPLNPPQIHAMVARVFDKDHNTLANKIVHQVDMLPGITATVLADFLFRHRHDDPNSLNVGELSQGTHKDHILEGRSTATSTMFM